MRRVVSRLDLYYRLSIIQIDIPPLRERGDDVLLLSQHYIDTIGARLRKNNKITSLSPQVVSVFRNYNWPGNVRELRNVIERTLILEDNETITTEYLPGGLVGAPRYILQVVVRRRLHSSCSQTGGISLDEAELLICSVRPSNAAVATRQRPPNCWGFRATN